MIANGAGGNAGIAAEPYCVTLTRGVDDYNIVRRETTGTPPARPPGYFLRLMFELAYSRLDTQQREALES